MKCAFCQTELPSAAMFCGECGRPVSAKPRPVAEQHTVGAATSSIPLIEPETAEPDEVPPAAPEPEVVEVSLPVFEVPEVELAPGTVLCVNCGAAMDASDIFCGECGFVSPDVAVPGAAAGDTTRIEIDLDAVADEVAVAPAPAGYAVDDEATRIVNRSVTGERFVLQFSTGENVSVVGTGLIGRHPVAEPGEYFDHLVTIVDPGKSVSKTHLEFGQEAGFFWVFDRWSANGTIIREPEVEPRRAEPGKRYRVVRGTRVDLGEQFLVVS